MILNTYDSIILFAALFISAHLLTTFVDYKSERRSMPLNKISAAILFPFIRKENYNAIAVCLQLNNYVISAIFIIGNFTGLYNYIGYKIQSLFIVIILIITPIEIILANNYIKKITKINQNNINEEKK